MSWFRIAGLRQGCLRTTHKRKDERGIRISPSQSPSIGSAARSAGAQGARRLGERIGSEPKRLEDWEIGARGKVLEDKPCPDLYGFAMLLRALS